MLLQYFFMYFLFASDFLLTSIISIDFLFAMNALYIFFINIIIHYILQIKRNRDEEYQIVQSYCCRSIIYFGEILFITSFLRHCIKYFMAQQLNKSATRKVFDSIYGFIAFPKQIWQFIDTPHFQRLRNIKQLGCLSWVFPGGVHSRFEHSLGTGHLAQKYITTLIKTHKDKTLNKFVYDSYYTAEESKSYCSIKQQAIFIITLAGILHDVGHGPYSHLFDSKVVQQVDGKGWQHEIASLCLIDHIYDYVVQKKSNQQQISWLLSTKNRVKALIIGKITKSRYISNGETMIYQKQIQVSNLQPGFNEIFKAQLKIRPWQFQIVSNRLTGIDVDKLDYFRRDAYYLGSKNIFIEHELLMSETLILQEPYSTSFKNNEKQESERHRLCYPSKYSDKVYDIYYSRYKLYKTYYLNLKSSGIDFMIADILKYSEPYFKFTEACRDLLNGNCQKYIRLTDSIIQKIQDIYDIVRLKTQNNQQLSEELKGIEKAGKIIEKLKRRQIYDFVKQYHRGFTFLQIGSYYKIKKEISKLIEEKRRIHENVILNCFQIGYGIKDKDPFEQCRFYDKTKQEKQIQTQNERLFSMLRPDKIIEVYLCFYLKNRIKNPTKDEKESIEKLEEQILQDIKKIDTKFISGYSGTYTNRSQGPPLFVTTNQIEAQRLQLQNNQQFDNQLKD